MKYHVTEYLGIPKGHREIDFVDIDLNRDTLLFIDPSLIDIKRNEWAQKAARCVHSYFDELYDAYKEKNIQKQYRLYSYAHEINSTKLGYGNGRNGKAKTANGMFIALQSLSKLTYRLETN